MEAVLVAMAERLHKISLTTDISRMERRQNENEAEFHTTGSTTLSDGFGKRIQKSMSGVLKEESGVDMTLTITRPVCIKNP